MSGRHHACNGARWFAGAVTASIIALASGSASASAVVVWAEAQESTHLIPGEPATQVFQLHFLNATADAETLAALRFDNAAVGAGSQAQMDASWSTLTLRGEASALGTATFVGGDLTFSGFAVVMAPGDTTTLTLDGGASTQARDGDALDVAVAGAANLTFSRNVPLSASWPLHPTGSYPVDGMSVNQIVVHAVPAANLLTGSNNNLVFDITVPQNGYAPDVLQKVNVFNQGTAGPSNGISRVSAWADGGDGVFNSATDRLLGILLFTGDRWELTALSEPVGAAGLRLFLTVDVAPAAHVGTTVRMSLVASADPAIGMASSNDGPVDRTASNPFAQVVSAANRVTFSAVPIEPGIASPGQEVPVMEFVATNSYQSARTLVSLHLTNGSESAHGGSQADRDSAIETITLRLDGNGNGSLDDVLTDPVLGVTSFSSGRASFRGLTMSIPAGASRTFFVEVGLSPRLAADADRVRASILNALDVAFEQPTTVVASWPLDSGARWTVDGMVVAQVVDVGVPASTFGPGDGPAPGLEIIVPSNGYATDELKGLYVVNRGTAGVAHFSDLRLWRDGGDGSFDAGSGDDIDIGPLVPVTGGWASPQLSESVPVGGVRLYVTFSVATTVTDSSTVQFAVPIGGIVMNSADDGPLDHEIANPAVLQLSPAPFLSSILFERDDSTVGQGLSARMIVRNVSGEVLHNVMPRDVQQAGSGALTLVSGPVPAALDMAVGAVDTFTYYFNAQSAGSLTLSGRAEGLGEQSASMRRSVSSTSRRHDVLVEAIELGMVPVGSLPLSLTRGQLDAVALNLTLLNSIGPMGSNIELQRMRIRFEDRNGNDIVPADLISGLTVGEGTTTYFTTSTVPASGSEMDFSLDSPVVVTGQEPVTVTLRMDISPTTVVPEFRLTIQDPSWFLAHDATNGANVPVVLEVGSFPIRSGIGELSIAPTTLEVTGVDAPDTTAAQGQLDAPLLQFDLANPGIPLLTTDVRFGALSLQLIDAVGGIVPLRDVFDRIRVLADGVLLEEDQLEFHPDTTRVVTLSQPASVTSSAPTHVDIVGDVRADAPRATYRLRIQDPASIHAVDPNTGQLLPVVFDPDPMLGSRVTIQGEASALLAGGEAGFSAYTVVGELNQYAMHVMLRHPGSADIGAIRVDALTITTRDERRSPLVPSRFLERVRVLSGGVEVGGLSSLPSSGGSFDVPLNGVVVRAGGGVDLTVRADIEATAPESYLELLVQASGVHAVDANVSTPVQVNADTGEELPLTSGVTKLEAPARELRAGLTSEMPAVLAADGSSVRMASVTLANVAPANSGAIRVKHLTVLAADRDLAALAIGTFASRLEARLGNTVWAISDSLAPDSLTATLLPDSVLQVMPGEPVSLQVFVTLRPQQELPPSIRIGIGATSVGVVQPTSAVVQVRVSAAGASSFPLWTLAGGFSELSLRESYANFPNPFAAGREGTAFAYYLRTDARVTLRILTPRGETVVRLLDGVSRSAGLHQNDLWNGCNERGVVVVNGVYVAELRVDYADGATERALHKVAVLR